MDILHHNYCYEVAVTWDKQKQKWEVLLHAPEHPIKFQLDLSSHLGVYRLLTSVINRNMIWPMLRHYYSAEASAEAESVEICIIRHLPRFWQ